MLALLLEARLLGLDDICKGADTWRGALQAMIWQSHLCPQHHSSGLAASLAVRRTLPPSVSCRHDRDAGISVAGFAPTRSETLPLRYSNRFVVHIRSSAASSPA